MSRRKRVAIIATCVVLASLLLTNRATERDASRALEDERESLRSRGFALSLDQLLVSAPGPDDDAAPLIRDSLALFVSPRRDDKGVFYAEGRSYSAATVDSFVNANAACLAKLDEALQRNRCSLGRDRIAALDPTPEDLLPLFESHEWRDLLCLKARRQAEQGDGDGALQTLSSALRFNRLLAAERPDLGAQMTRLHADAQVCGAVAGVLNAGTPSILACRAFERQIATLESDRDLPRAVAYHRVCVQRLFQLVREGRQTEWLPVLEDQWAGICFPHPFPEKHPWLYSWGTTACGWIVDQDEVQFLRVSSRIEELVRAVGRGTSDSIEQLAKEVDAKPGVLTNLSFAFWPPLHIKGILEAEAGRGLARVALALRVHRMQHGAYPTKLDELDQTVFSSVPRDPFSGDSLVYKPAGGGWVVYSIGPNGRDDGGANVRRSWEREQPDDVTTRIER